MKGFKILFSVVIYHDYFESGFCPDVGVHPSRATLAQAKNSGIIFKPCLGGLLVLCDLDKLPILLLYIEDEGLLFDFYVTSNNGLLSDYSSFSLFKSGKLLWLKHDLNLNDSPVNDKGGYSLHHAERVSENDYALKEDISGFDEFETLGSSYNTVMFISMNINMQEFNRLSLGSPPSSVTNFSASIKNKSSFWEYRVHTDDINKNIGISDRDNNVEFIFVRNDSLGGDRNVAIFRSDIEIKSKEFSDCFFQLINKRTSGDQVLVKRLPVANFNNGYQEVVDTKLAQISEIFVNF